MGNWERNVERGKEHRYKKAEVDRKSMTAFPEGGFMDYWKEPRPPAPRLKASAEGL